MFLIATPSGDRYVIHDNGDIERTDIAGSRPSGQWKMLGLQHVKRREFIPMDKLADALPSLALAYKNGKPQYTVRDRDRGTMRKWGNTAYHGVRSIRPISLSDVNFLRASRDRS